MIHWKNLLQIIAFLLLGLAAFQAVALGVSLGYQDEGVRPLTLSTVVTALCGLLLLALFRPSSTSFNNRDGMLLVILAWVAAGFFGALPFYFSDSFEGLTDAVFESISGFTTTGATILGDIEAVAPGLLFWRSFTQWLGGMGIILLGIAILPLVGTGGMELYRAEFSGAKSEKIKPRIAETALALWKIYFALTVVLFLALLLAGMSVFDAVNHAFTTMATGGFSTRNESIAAYQSPAIEVICAFFMLMAGFNFTRHYRLFIRRRPDLFIRDLEVRSYLLIVAAAILAVGATLYQPGISSVWEALRLASFQVISIMTTTGFASADFELWTPFAQLLLLALMFVGGSTGSTAGGLKVARIVLLMRVVGREFRRSVERRGVFVIRFNKNPISESAIGSLLNLIYLAFIVNFMACLALTAFGVDVLTAISAVAAAMFNIGPGLGTVGPAENFGHLAAPVKWILAFCMLAGRLEFYTLLVVCTRAFWKK